MRQAVYEKVVCGSSPFLVENGLALNETTNPTKPLCGEEMSSAESSSASSIKRDSGAV